MCSPQGLNAEGDRATQLWYIVWPRARLGEPPRVLQAYAVVIAKTQYLVRVLAPSDVA
jgi:hypothetical protein